MKPTSKKRIKTSLFISSIFLFGAEFVVGCSGERHLDSSQTVILISLDGFRWDYTNKTTTPNLDFLIQTGVRAKSLIPSFPTSTFPNHYTIVTGLFPENHGIISNVMCDPDINERFDYYDPSTFQNERWWEGEPIWITARKKDLVSASYFWVGSEVKINGLQPTYWFPYDWKIPNETRIRQILEWLDLPREIRPSLILCYFSLLDYLGHKSGPDSKEVINGIQEIDSVIGILINGLKERNILHKTNIITVSDHGMTNVSPERVIVLDDYINITEVDVITWSAVVTLNPVKGKESNTYSALHQAHPKLKIYRKEGTPERFHYTSHRRIPKIIGLADEGWIVTDHSYYKKNPQIATGGNHGYDNRLKSMRGIFIARGPAFKSGIEVNSFQNIHIYSLICKILDLEPAPNDGNLDSVRVMLRNSNY